MGVMFNMVINLLELNVEILANIIKNGTAVTNKD